MKIAKVTFIIAVLALCAHALPGKPRFPIAVARITSQISALEPGQILKEIPQRRTWFYTSLDNEPKGDDTAAVA